MAKYTDSKCRLCRREGEKLFLKGEKSRLRARARRRLCGARPHLARPGRPGTTPRRKRISR